jgi:hypothetical protein
VSATMWMVLNPDQDRILMKTPSLLEAFRFARRKAGSSAHMEHDVGFGVQVRGRKASLTVFRVLVDGRSDAPEVLPGRPLAEHIVLSEGGSFIWVPAA